MAAAIIALCALAGLVPGPAGGAIYQAGVTAIAPGYVKLISDPVAVLGINLSQNGGELFTEVTVTFNDFGADGKFNSTDLALLSSDECSGVAVYEDNKTSGTFGVFDKNDTFVKPSWRPQWTALVSAFCTTVATSGVAIPSDDLGNSTGPDMFVVIRTSGTASEGDDFTATIGPNGVLTDAGPVAVPGATTGRIVVDAIDPCADAGPDSVTDEGVETSFYGGGSNDNSGVANYSWFFGDFAPDSHASGISASHIYQYPGQYIVILNVTDLAGNTDEDTAVITVRNVNQPPVIYSLPPTSAVQGETYYYLCQASDPDGDSLKFSLVEGPANMTIDPKLGLVSWTPGIWDVGGGKQVGITVTDVKSGPVKQSYFITVQNMNDPPFFTSNPVLIAIQNEPYYYQAEAVDPDFDVQIVFSLAAGPPGMNVSPYTGLVSWTPNWQEVGLNRVVLAASDGYFTAYQDFVINVSNTNDPPQILSVPLTTALQGVLYTYRVKALDPDGDDLEFYLNPAPAGMIIDRRTGVVTWTPEADQVGAALVRLEVSDRRATANQTFYIDVANVNDPPSFMSVPPGYAKQGSPYTYRLIASDPDGDSLIYALLSGPKGMVLNSSLGMVEWVPGQQNVGRSQVVLEVSDGHGGLAVQSYTVTVQDLNDPPVVLGDLAPFAYQCRTYVSQIQAYDPDGDDLVYTLITQLPNMELDRHSGILVWLPSKSQVGQYRIAARVTDQNGTSTDSYFNITVLGTNDPPVAGSIGLLKGREGQRFYYRVKASDPDGDQISFNTDSRLFKINATSGEIIFTPGARSVGAHQFTVTVIDPGGLNDTVTGVLEIAGKPAAPPTSKAAGFGLAGVGGFNVWAIVAVAAGAGLLLVTDYLYRLRLEQEAMPQEPVWTDRGVPERRERAGRDRAHRAGVGQAIKLGTGMDGKGGEVEPEREAERLGKPGSRKCAGCRQTININATADNHACACGAVYHKDCLRKMGNKCAACGRGKDERKKGK